MFPQTRLLIETMKFPVFEREMEGHAIEGMFGKSLCNYLQAKLPLVEIQVPFFFNEGWGWWLQTASNGFRMSLGIASDPGADIHEVTRHNDNPL